MLNDLLLLGSSIAWIVVLAWLYRRWDDRFSVPETEDDLDARQW